MVHMHVIMQRFLTRICSRLRKLLTSLQPLRHCRYQILTAVLPVALINGLVVCYGSILFAPFKAEKFGVDLQTEISTRNIHKS